MQRIALILSTALFLSSQVRASEQEYICGAKHGNEHVLPILSQDCPIGQGLWGKTPDSDQGLFWIQCGLSGVPLSLKNAQLIHNNISAKVFLKQEQGRYRCLIGPYKTFTIAKSDLVKVKQLEAYKEAFIRDASSDSDKLDKVTASVSSGSKAENIARPPKPKKPAVRREAEIEGHYFAIPFIMGNSKQYYMEHGVAWNRLSYDQALQACQSQQMRLPVAEEWRVLHSSQLMTEKQWPLQLPYWGEGKQGLFSSGKITQLSGTSLLNVLCVK